MPWIPPPMTTILRPSELSSADAFIVEAASALILDVNARRFEGDRNAEDECTAESAHHSMDAFMIIECCFLPLLLVFGGEQRVVYNR